MSEFSNLFAGPPIPFDVDAMRRTVEKARNLPFRPEQRTSIVPPWLWDKLLEAGLIDEHGREAITDEDIEANLKRRGKR